MNPFGLGIELEFRDRATAGMERASRAFKEMSGIADNLTENVSVATKSVEQLIMAGFAITDVGENFSQIGGNIIDLYSNSFKAVVGTGNDLLSARMQLSALYGSMEAGEQVLTNIKEYAKQSIFNFEDLIPAVIMMKSVGVEAFDMIASSTGNANQTLLDYAADLAAFNPQMMNMYGTGVQAAMGAIKEYVAEGSEISLKRGAGLDITAILGEEKGATIEERSRQVADLLEKLNMVGAVANLAGTPMQRLSNAQDVLFDILSRISDSGVFEKYTELVATFTDYIFAIPEEELQNISQSIADSFVMILNPLIKLTELGLSFVDILRGIIREYPSFAKIITGFSLLAGVILFSTGILLRFSGNMFMFMSALKGMKEIGSFAAIFNLFLTGIKSVTLFLIPLIAVSYLLYNAWSKNIGGIADLIKNVLKKAFETLDIVLDAFWDNTLSVEKWNKAREMGILPFIETLLTIKQLVTDLAKSFISVLDVITEIFIKGSINMFQKAKDLFTVKMRELAEIIPETLSNLDWKAISGIIITGLLFVLNPSLLSVILFPLISIFSKLGTVLITVLGSIVLPLVTSLLTKLGILITSGLSSLMGLPIIGSFIRFFIGIPITVIGGIISTIGATPILIGAAIISAIAVIVSLITGNKEKILNAFQSLWLKLPEPVRNTLTGIFNFISNIVNNIIDKLGLRPVIDRISEVLPVIIDWFSMMGDKIINIFGNIVEWVRSAWDNWLGDLVLGVGTFVMNVIEIIGGLLAVILPILLDVLNVIIQVVTPVIDIIGNAFLTIINIINIFLESVIKVISGIIKALKGLIDFIVGVFTLDWKRAWGGILDFFTGIFDSIVNIVKTVFSGIIEAAKGVDRFLRGITNNSIEKTATITTGTPVPSNTVDVPKLSTGGFIKSEGLSYLHPNEVVVNSPLTDKLSGFLNDYSNNNTPSTAYPLSMNTENEDEIDVEYIDLEPANNRNDSQISKRQYSSNDYYDYKVVFNQGSIIINVENLGDENLDEIATKLMRIIERKQELKNMKNRNRGVLV